jgi:hypothetical protein
MATTKKTEKPKAKAVQTNLIYIGQPETFKVPRVTMWTFVCSYDPQTFTFLTLSDGKWEVDSLPRVLLRMLTSSDKVFICREKDGKANKIPLVREDLTPAMQFNLMTHNQACEKLVLADKEFQGFLTSYTGRLLNSSMPMNDNSLALMVDRYQSIRDSILSKNILINSWFSATV